MLTKFLIGPHPRAFENVNFFPMSQQPKSVLGRPTVEVYRSHTHTRSRTPLCERSARRRRRFLHNTRQTQETNIHALSEIRTRDPSNQATADMFLRRHGHRDRLNTVHVWPYLQRLSRYKKDVHRADHWFYYGRCSNQVTEIKRSTFQTTQHIY